MANEEEYHIPEQDYSPATDQIPEMPHVPAQGGNSTLVRRVVIAAMVMVSIWGMHKIYTAVMHGKNKNQNITGLTTPTPIAEVSTTKPTFSPAPTSAAASQAQAAGAVVAKIANTVESRVSNIEETNAEVQAQVERINANVADIQSTLANLSAQMSAMNNTVQDLSAQVSQQQTQMQLATVMQEEKKAKQRAVAKKMGGTAPARTVYYLQAMVPGRAWLVSDKGSMLTVKIGDLVPGYGEVVSIDTNLNAVTTSNDSVITLKEDS